MKTIEEFRQFYDAVLMPDLKGLEEKRKGLLRRVMALDVGLIALAMLALYLTYQGTSSGGKNTVNLFITEGIIAIILVSPLVGWANKSLTRGFRDEFKSSIVRRIARFLDENLDYVQDARAGRGIAVESQLFSTSKEEDLVSGKLGGTRVDFFECDFSVNITPFHSNPRLHGILFAADFNKNFEAYTIALPNTFGRWVAANNAGPKRLQRAELEDPVFESLFDVYSEDQVGARYIFSTSLMQRLADFRTRLKRKVFVAFSGTRMFIAMPLEKNLFEPSLFGTLLAFSQVKSYFDDLLFTVGIVEDLNLNTRIWGKR